MSLCDSSFILLYEVSKLQDGIGIEWYQMVLDGIGSYLVLLDLSYIVLNHKKIFHRAPLEHEPFGSFECLTSYLSWGV